MQPGRSQQALAEQLGTPATRLVALLDALERRGAIERRRNPDDRRLHALHMTEGGQGLLRSVGQVAMAHGADLTAALEDSERAQLQRLLLLIAQDKKLAAGVHPGFRMI
jgi:DNA-binding MarR family transcriptional regulator